MTSPREREPSMQIVLQRVRNRIVDCLELSASVEAQRTFNSRGLDAPYEMLQFWDDWVGENWKRKLVSPTFSEEEIIEIEKVQLAWNEVLSSTPDPMPPLDELLLAPHWQRLCSAAHDALRTFNIRGRLPEE
jgi:hypothetical protein